ncbi:MAG: FAD-dependent monooxygenase [Hyphomicrobiales bacterium]|nr:FAD-dependent monooxygenase [Hyphomicrobiales bacterium]
MAVRPNVGRRCDVLVVGAGPTGLVLALWLVKLGASVRIVDEAEGPGTASRALAVQARTLELYRQLDLADPVAERAYKVAAVNFWKRGQAVARVPFEEVGSTFTPYPSLQIFPQDEHERLLVDRLAAAGLEVERQTELLDCTQDSAGAVATLRRPDGDEELCEAQYIAGCDGAHSRLREILGVGFGGGTYPHLFYVADLEASGPAVNGELVADLDDADFLAIFPLAAERRVRLIGAVRGEAAERAESLSFADVSRRAMENLRLNVETINWFSTYRVHHRVAERFRSGRAFLLGDAAHIHSPVGGQGMNTGIGDAINLAWKLKAALDGKAPDKLLDSFEAERIAFARRLVSTTDRLFAFVTTEGPLANAIRLNVAPVALSALGRIEAWREWLFWTISQIGLNYRGGPLSSGRAGRVHGGDRLPWVSVAGGDTFQTLGSRAWQAHVYGVASADLVAWCRDRGLPLHVFPWAQAYGEAGLAPNALYLLRPDDYVAAADEAASIEALSAYFDARGLTP